MRLKLPNVQSAGQKAPESAPHNRCTRLWPHPNGCKKSAIKTQMARMEIVETKNLLNGKLNSFAFFIKKNTVQAKHLNTFLLLHSVKNIQDNNGSIGVLKVKNVKLKWILNEFIEWTKIQIFPVHAHSIIYSDGILYLTIIWLLFLSVLFFMM